jgi:hypothetical protein
MCIYIYIYIYIWDNDFDYQRTLVVANHYYETSSYKAKKSQQNSMRENYKLVSHGYLNVEVRNYNGMSHYYDISMNKQMSIRGVGDSIASSF